MNNNVYKIELQTELYNFYIVNNILNKNFLLFYLENYLNKPIKKNLLLNDCLLNIVDNNVNILKVDMNTDYIIINKTDYNINKINK